MPPSEGLSPTLSATSTPQGISQEMDALIPPIPPAQLATSRQQDGVLLSWMGTGLDIDTHYVVYRRSSGGDTWEALGYIATQGDNRGAYSYLDTPPAAGQAYSYAVTTVNRYGKESDQAIVELEQAP